MPEVQVQHLFFMCDRSLFALALSVLVAVIEAGRLNRCMECVPPATVALV